MPDDPGADFHELLAQPSESPIIDPLGQGQCTHEVGEIIGQRMELKPHGVVPEGSARQPGPADRVLSLFDPLLGSAATVVELHHPVIRARQVGDDKADTRIEFAAMPFDPGNYPARLAPALRLVAEAGDEDLRLVGRSPHRSGQQGRDALLQDAIGWQPSSIADAFGLQEFVEFRLGKGGVGAKVDRGASLAIPDDHRLQHGSPILGAVRIARTQKAALEIAELVEQEQWMIAGAGKVPAIGGALLTAVGRAHRAVHVENDAVRRLAVMDTIDPCAAEISEGFQIVIGRQPFGLEPPHLAAGGAVAVVSLTTNDRAHDRIGSQPLGVVDILVAGETNKDRLPQECGQTVVDISAASALAEDGRGEIRETDNVVQFAIGEQATVRRDAGAMKFELDPAVEDGASELARAFHPSHSPFQVTVASIVLNNLAESAPRFTKMGRHMGIGDQETNGSRELAGGAFVEGAPQTRYHSGLHRSVRSDLGLGLVEPPFIPRRGGGSSDRTRRLDVDRLI